MWCICIHFQDRIISHHLMRECWYYTSEVHLKWGPWGGGVSYGISAVLLPGSEGMPILFDFSWGQCRWNSMLRYLRASGHLGGVVVWLDPCLKPPWSEPTNIHLHYKGCSLSRWSLRASLSLVPHPLPRGQPSRLTKKGTQQGHLVMITPGSS